MHEKNVETNESDQTSESLLGKQTEEINEVSQSPEINLNDHKLLVELIRDKNVHVPKMQHNTSEIFFLDFCPIVSLSFCPFV